jgi:hypothetical protein
MHVFIRNSVGRLLVLFAFLWIGACSSTSETSKSIPLETVYNTQTTEAPVGTPQIPTETAVPLPTKTLFESLATPTAKPTGSVKSGLLADVLSVAVSGDENAYRFSVEIQSPDTGCDQYADWWEVVSEDGELVYRRILAHSHVDEQPFTRSGGPVAINADLIVIVRAHMHPGGYGGTVFRGSVADGFEIIQLGSDFAESLSESEPLPSGCAF